MGVTTLRPGYSASQGILIELLLSLVLVMVFIHTTMEKSEYRPIAPLAVGFALTSGILARFVSVSDLFLGFLPLFTQTCNTKNRGEPGNKATS